MAARSWAKRTGFAFTTAFHTRFAEYIKARTGLPVRPVYAWMRRFHGAAQGTMVATQSLRDELTARGFRNIRSWSRGVDLELFKPEPREEWGSAAAGVPLCRPGGGGEEHRRVSRSRSAGIEGGGRRRADPAAAAARVSQRAVHRPALWRGAGACLCRRGRVRVSQPDRHVRPGAAGGAGLRHAGRGVSGDRADRRAGRCARQGRRGECGPARGGAGGADAPIARRAGRMRSAIRGARAPRCSCRIWCRWRALRRTGCCGFPAVLDALALSQSAAP